MSAHIVDGEFKSDKYPWCPKGFVPLKLTDKDAEIPLRMYATWHVLKDQEFSDDLRRCLDNIYGKFSDVKLPPDND